MRRVPVYLLLVIMAAAMACGRGGGDTVTVPALLEAERLLSPEVDAADSALRVLRAVDTAALATAGDRALYALLRTQALFKNAVRPIDTIPIQSAVAYFDLIAPGSDRHIRALTYAGGAAENSGDFPSAMHYYKMAELTTPPTDYYNKGYTTMRMAVLYSDATGYSKYAIKKLRQSIDWFKKANCHKYVLANQLALSLEYYDSNPDEALIYAIDGWKLANRNGDQINMQDAAYSLAICYNKKGEADSVLKYGHYIFDRDPEMMYESKQYLFHMAAAFALKEMDDSMLYYLDKVLPPKNLFDSVWLADVKYRHAQRLGDSLVASYYDQQALLLSNRCRVRSYDNKLNVVEEQVAAQYALDIEAKLGARNRLWLWLAIVLMTLAAIVLIVRNRRHRRLNVNLEQLLDTLNQQVEKYKSSSADDDSQFLFATIHQVVDNVIVKGKNTCNGNGKDMRNFNIANYHLQAKNELPELFWKNLYEYINKKYSGILDHMVKRRGQVSTMDRQFVALACFGIHDVLIAFVFDMNVKSVANKRRSIPKDYFGVEKNFKEWLRDLCCQDLNTNIPTGHR